MTERGIGAHRETQELLRMKMTKEQLAQMITSAVADVVPAQVESALAPIQEQQTSWMAKIEEAKAVAHGGTVDPAKRGIGAARFVRALAFGQGNPDKAAHFAKKAWDDPMGAAVAKALMAGDFTAGGALVPPEFLSEVIELLRARSVVRAAGPRVLPMNNGTLTLRKHTGGSTASYVGESQDITKTQQTTGQIVMSAKKLAALVPISNDLLHFSSGPAADEFVRDDLVQQMATREDQAFLRDNGASDTPKGLRYWAAAANITSTNGTSVPNVESDFKDLLNALEQSNVGMIRPVWFMAPRSKNHLLNLREAGGGNLVYPGIRDANPTIYGFPVYISTNVPTNLGGGTETELYLVDMADMVIGDVGTLEIAVDSSASYIESGSLVSAFSRDETVMRAISRHDFAARHDESIALKSDVAWGA